MDTPENEVPEDEIPFKENFESDTIFAYSRLPESPLGMKISERFTEETGKQFFLFGEGRFNVTFEVEDVVVDGDSIGKIPVALFDELKSYGQPGDTFIADSFVAQLAKMYEDSRETPSV